MVSFAFISPGHTHDRSAPSVIQAGGGLAFVTEVLGKNVSDVSSTYNLWCATRAKGTWLTLTFPLWFTDTCKGQKGGNSLKEMRKECTEAFSGGLSKRSPLTPH